MLLVTLVIGAGLVALPYLRGEGFLVFVLILFPALLATGLFAVLLFADENWTIEPPSQARVRWFLSHFIAPLLVLAVLVILNSILASSYVAVSAAVKQDPISRADAIEIARHHVGVGCWPCYDCNEYTPMKIGTGWSVGVYDRIPGGSTLIFLDSKGTILDTWRGK